MSWRNKDRFRRDLGVHRERSPVRGRGVSVIGDAGTATGRRKGAIICYPPFHHFRRLFRLQRFDPMRTLAFFLLLLALAPFALGGGGSIKPSTGVEQTTAPITTGAETTGEQMTTDTVTTGSATTGSATTGQIATTGCSVSSIVCQAAYNVCSIDIRTGASGLIHYTPTPNATTCACDLVSTFTPCTGGTTCNVLLGCVEPAPAILIDNTVNAASCYSPASVLLLVSSSLLALAQATWFVNRQ